MMSGIEFFLLFLHTQDNLVQMIDILLTFSHGSKIYFDILDGTVDIFMDICLRFGQFL